jgi:hypothetical protein
MIKAKPENLVGDPLDEELRRDGIEMIAPQRANRSNCLRKIDAVKPAICAAGSLSGSSPGSNGSADSSSAGSARTSWALFNSPASSSSGDFEIGSS